MAQADGFLSVLPYRPDKGCTTSSFMLDELSMAVNSRLPIALIYDARVEIAIADNDTSDIVSLGFSDGRAVEIPKEILVFHAGYDFGVPKSEEIQLASLFDFLDVIAQARSTTGRMQPYSFLICRLQSDFELPRRACIVAAERAAGMRCLWIDSHDYRANVEDTVERVRLLIKNAQFVVAEISLTEENPDFDNPSRAHEIGLATAYRKKVFAVSHGPRRHPYHGLVSRQLVWWDDEDELYSELSSAIHAERGAVGRHIYNRELEKLGDGFFPRFATPHFDPIAAPRWSPPVTGDEGGTQSWMYALSFGFSAGCIALLLRRLVGYEDTLDLVALFAGTVAFFFSSRISRRIQKALQQPTYLRWLIPLFAVLLFLATIVVSQLGSEAAPSDQQVSYPLSSRGFVPHNSP